MEISTSTEYYRVRGSTSQAMFEAIDRVGLADASGRRAVGLTAARWKLDTRTVQEAGLSCNTARVRIAVHLVMTLPQLDPAADLPAELRARWDGFAARVAAHEQRHVDIYVDGVRRMKARMERALEAPGPCVGLQASIQSIWTSQQAETEAEQERFHLDEDARLERDRAPLQAQIDTSKARLTAITSEAREVRLALEDLRRQITAAASRADALQAEIARSAGSPSGCWQRVPPPVQALCVERDGIVTAHNALVERHNRLVERNSILAEEHRRTQTITNDLIDALNWTR